MSYQTDLQAASRTSESIQAISTKVDNGVDELMQYANQHLKEWTGDARDSYYVVEAQWRAAQGEMAAALVKARAALDEMHALIQHGELKGSGTWQATKVGF
ncbi:WXG100 family type VII secretion target [Actinoplanes sp. NPDC051859]|uniref:WXG100 family type VII secretion target n=1 Tax=Actinoplanes sp. NPDC051859 TaxID=3363909 RepID=UPI0037A21148